MTEILKALGNGALGGLIVCVVYLSGELLFTVMYDSWSRRGGKKRSIKER